MRNTIALIIVFVLLSYQIIPTIIFVDFSIHRDFIAEFLCVNKDVPESSCNGQCHLKQEIDKATPPKGEEEPASFSYRKITQINCSINQVLRIFEFVVLKTNLVFNQDLKLTAYIGGVFRPPQVIL